MKKVNHSNLLTQKILSHLFKSGAFAWRANTTGVWDQARGLYRSSPKKGVSDILGCFHGRFLAIEVKSPTDHLSPEQEGFQRSVEHVQGVAFMVKSFDEYLIKFSTHFPS